MYHSQILHRFDTLKNLLTFFLFVFIKQSHGQEIELKGCYGASFIGGEIIEFVGKDSFYFDGFYCTYGVHGKGRSALRDNKLYLFFEKNKTTKKLDTLNQPIISKAPSTDSNLVIQIEIVDNNNIPIPFASVEIERDKSAKIGAIADTAGGVLIKIPNNALSISVRTSAVGIEPRYLKLESGFNYNIKLFHSKKDFFDKELINGGVLVYEVDELTNDYILMRPEKSSGPFRKYKKIKD